MKKNHLFAFITLVVVVLFASCKKSNDAGSSTSQPSIVGKWNAVDEVDWFTPNVGAVQKDTYKAEPGEFIEFKTDGKANYYWWNDSNSKFETDNYEYIVKGSSLIINEVGYPDKDTLEIKTLSTKSLSLYSLDSYNTGKYETWLNFNR